MPEAKFRVMLLSHTPEPEETVALAARLCYSDSDILSLGEAVRERAPQFIERLTALGHLSPFEHASFTFGAEGVSRALLAQLTRHRLASFSVQSQRYVRQDGASYIIPPSVAALPQEKRARYGDMMDTVQAYYRELLSYGIAPEDARFVLPNAAETRMVFTMNARELLHFFELRCCARAQWEIRTLAWAMLGIALREAPHLFCNAGPGCAAGVCSEGKMSCGRPGDSAEYLALLRTLAKDRATDEEITSAAMRLIRR